MDYYKYRGIPKDPLTYPEAHSCLYDLVPKLVQVIEGGHTRISDVDREGSVQSNHPELM